jgi:hypothetical protein
MRQTLPNTTIPGFGPTERRSVILAWLGRESLSTSQILILAPIGLKQRSSPHIAVTIDHSQDRTCAAARLRVYIREDTSCSPR